MSQNFLKRERNFIPNEIFDEKCPTDILGIGSTKWEIRHVKKAQGRTKDILRIRSTNKPPTRLGMLDFVGTTIKGLSTFLSDIVDILSLMCRS